MVFSQTQLSINWDIPNLAHRFRWVNAHFHALSCTKQRYPTKEHLNFCNLLNLF